MSLDIRLIGRSSPTRYLYLLGRMFECSSPGARDSVALNVPENSNFAVRSGAAVFAALFLTIFSTRLQTVFWYTANDDRDCIQKL